MSTSVPAAPADFDRATIWRARLAVFAVFLVIGTGVGLWAVHIPIVTTRLHLDPAVLGLALLTIGIGAIISMPIVSVVAARFGTRHVSIAAAFLFAVTMPLPIFAPDLTFLFVGCALFGLAMGGTDVSINAHGAEVEAAYGRPTMSAFHGFFSLGGLFGAGLGALVIGIGLGDGAGAIGVTVALVLVVWAAFNLLPSTSATVGVQLVWPTRAVIGIGLLCGLAFALEGIVTDWSTLFLFQEKAANPVVASAGVALFMATMALFRFLGDRIKLLFGGRRVVVASGICVAAGTALAILAPWAWLCAVGFGLVGVGAANVVPVLFSASAQVPGVPAAIGIASVASLGYAGHLLAPPLIGFMARSFGLPLALSLVGVAGIVIAAGGLRLAK